jgi:hypothetical protein
MYGRRISLGSCHFGRLTKLLSTSRVRSLDSRTCRRVICATNLRLKAEGNSHDGKCEWLRTVHRDCLPDDEYTIDENIHLRGVGD